MPLKSTKKRAQADKRQGKAASTQAGEYVREQMHKMKRGKGNARSRRQAIAIGLSEARRSGVKVKGQPRSKRQTTARKSSRKSSGKSSSSSSRSRSRSRR
jgi:hypothetical protein